MSEKIIIALVGALAGLIGGLVTVAGNVYATRRQPPFSRNRLQVDLQILKNAKELGLDTSRLEAWLTAEIAFRYRVLDHQRRALGTGPTDTPTRD
jgi:hypothetical protein